MQDLHPLPPTRRIPDPFELFTGGKSPELAIYFNMAYSNLTKLIDHLENTNGSKIARLRDTTFIKLRDCLWKGYWENKNKSGYALQPEDKELIIALYSKLNSLRNFQSHIWHDHIVNQFSPLLHRFIADCLDIACAAASEKYPKEVDFFYKQLKDFPHFQKHGGHQYITKEGKVFFLSLFLTRGEMSSLLQQLKGSKRTDMPQFKIKHVIYKHFCHRDGSILMPFHHEETFFQQMDPDVQDQVLRARQAYKIVSYLNDIQAKYIILPAFHY